MASQPSFGTGPPAQICIHTQLNSSELELRNRKCLELPDLESEYNQLQCVMYGFCSFYPTVKREQFAAVQQTHHSAPWYVDVRDDLQPRVAGALLRDYHPDKTYGIYGRHWPSVKHDLLSAERIHAHYPNEMQSIVRLCCSQLKRLIGGVVGRNLQTKLVGFKAIEAITSKWDYTLLFSSYEHTAPPKYIWDTGHSIVVNGFTDSKEQSNSFNSSLNSSWTKINQRSQRFSSDLNWCRLQSPI